MSIAPSVQHFPRQATRGPLYATVSAPAEATWVRSVRRFAVVVLKSWGLARDECDTAELVIGELAANAAQYGGRDLTLSMSLDPGCRLLNVDVADSGVLAKGTRPERAGEPCERGRGLQIVECLTEWVSVEPRPDGRCVRAGIRVATVRPVPSS